jgi:hypothetical protein
VAKSRAGRARQGPAFLQDSANGYAKCAPSLHNLLCSHCLSVEPPHPAQCLWHGLCSAARGLDNRFLLVRESDSRNQQAGIGVLGAK